MDAAFIVEILSTPRICRLLCIGINGDFHKCYKATTITCAVTFLLGVIMAALAIAFVVQECIRGAVLFLSDIKWILQKTFITLSSSRSAITRAYSSLVVEPLPRRKRFPTRQTQKSRRNERVS